jgi:hypothetical protein
MGNLLWSIYVSLILKGAEFNVVGICFCFH